MSSAAPLDLRDRSIPTSSRAGLTRPGLHRDHGHADGSKRASKETPLQRRVRMLSDLDGLLESIGAALSESAATSLDARQLPDENVTCRR